MAQAKNLNTFTTIIPFINQSNLEKHLSIVVPLYNPTANWLSIISTELEWLQTEFADFELVLVNDGSNRNIADEFIKMFGENKHIRLISYHKNEGKGYAIRMGVKNAAGGLLIYTDVDFPYTRQSFTNIYNALKNGADVAVGVRPESYYDSLPKSRTFISKSLRFVIRNLLRIPTDDTQCGLKGFNQNGREAFLQTNINRYLFDMEFITLAARKELSIKLVEVHLKPGIQMAAMPLGILIQESKNFLKILFS